MGEEMGGKKMGEFVLEGRCPEAMELTYELIACGSPSHSGGSASIPVGE